MGAIVSLVIVFGFTWIAGGKGGMNIPDYLDMALFLKISSFCFQPYLRRKYWIAI